MVVRWTIMTILHCYRVECSVSALHIYIHTSNLYFDLVLMHTLAAEF